MQTFHHYSVLLKESIEGLNIHPNGIYVDCTLGGGGHSSEILKQLDKGFLYAFDQDIDAIEAANTRLETISNRYEIIKSNFKHIKTELEKRDVKQVDGIIFDLGVSSPQFDHGERGFSYKHDARLDMRMDVSQTLSAYEIVNDYSFQDLFRIINRYGEEKYAKNIAREIEKTRMKKPIETTLELVDVIKRSVPYKSQREKHPAKRTFQALRIETNKELEILPQTLEDAIDILKIGGRICVITFHSLEDKLTKDIFKKYSTQPEIPRGLPILPQDEEETVLKLINRKVIIATPSELEENNRSRSAKLRIACKNKEK
ncbi:16S rRNA (cytosine(1402)-N(4))-methyltransferase RsmH [Mycoplasmatota bacterium]|nr:16S rRNA (cytosine(1402)-N(4))-methyltransferase RsmH [Mycoplasmatota bacterium]